MDDAIVQPLAKEEQQELDQEDEENACSSQYLKAAAAWSERQKEDCDSKSPLCSKSIRHSAGKTRLRTALKYRLPVADFFYRL
ncbi:hypothetical protein M514_12882 [Trichuris suis]|uniref:Uncharacterized protein n=1 Tax=Trichuris suis TaxID=68888 RepID=A0A085LMP3_9BILA|nr:hypothetical protein M513_12882 [Trichuris suis]KFD60404.1 hypothetical protein M514_12882 [Trichuris suis]